MTDERIRIDKWLWYARQAKSRTIAQKLVTSGKVRINREKIASPSKFVGPGDILTLILPRAVIVLKIAKCGNRRGPYEEAKSLYEDLSPPASPRRDRRPEFRGEPIPGKRPEGRERLAARHLAGKQ